jgi:hypothetical protein
MKLTGQKSINIAAWFSFKEDNFTIIKKKYEIPS